MLNGKQEKFCQLYIAGNSATQSYIDAGYNVSSERVAAANAYKLLRKADIVNRLKELGKPSRDEIAMTVDEMHEHINEIARDKNLKPDVRLRAIEQSAKLQGLMTQKIETNVNMVTVVEMVGDIDG